MKETTVSKLKRVNVVKYSVSHDIFDQLQVRACSGIVSLGEHSQVELLFLVASLHCASGNTPGLIDFDHLNCC